MLLIIVTAILPALLLGWWIYRKDSLRPEPLKQLYRAFLFGVGSAFVSLLISTLMGLMGLMVYDIGSYTGAVSTALFAAALPEEVAKLTMLWLCLRKNPYYDEYFDGIVYAACVGLGFAATENVLYLLQSEDWLMTGLIRGITAVPAHFAIACAMGYFYSKRHFGDNSRLIAHLARLSQHNATHRQSASARQGTHDPAADTRCSFLIYTASAAWQRQEQQHSSGMTPKECFFISQLMCDYWSLCFLTRRSYSGLPSRSRRS